MNKIGAGQCDDILDSFASDSSGLEETSNVRARERRDSHIFFFRDWYNIMTARGLREGRYFRIYENSFSRKRSRFDEAGRISLCAKKRAKYE
ncbi:MAG: hypothetical protein J6S14_21615 [Clostridia bacterium]|nr:hypothetical protein [Clostridia bacterium]